MNKKTIFVMGDSISIGYGPFLKEALPESIHYDRLSGKEEALKNLDIPVGGNGGDSKRVLSLLKSFHDGGDFHVDLLMINCGLHDIKQDDVTKELQVSPEEYRSNVKAIFSVAQELASHVVWMTTTPIDDARHAERRCGFGRQQAHIATYNRIASQVVAESGVSEIPLADYTQSLGRPDELYRDGVHFEDPIAEKQGRYLAEWVNSFFSGPESGSDRAS